MDLSQVVVTSGGILLIGLTVWFFFGKSSKAPVKGQGGTYACPMHPWVTSEDPTAVCEICGMKLVKS